MSFRTQWILVLSLVLWVVAPTLAQGQTSEGLVDILKDTQGLTHFARMVDAMGLAERYNNATVFYTVFALEDDTADALLRDLGYDSLDDLNDADKLALTVILTYHFLPGAYNEAAFESIQTVVDGPVLLASSLTGTTLMYDNGTIDNFAKIIKADIPTSNGYIHIVDNYLVPTKDAFEKSSDVLTSDTQLLKKQSDQDTLAENLRRMDQFSMFTEAFEAMGLMDNLDQPGPYTLFVMTNDSLSQVLKNANLSWDDLLADKNSMTQLLLYHLLSGQYSSAALRQYDGAYAGTMLLHTVVGFTVDKKGDIRVNNALITGKDVVASNGIIHIIDGVLLPPSQDTP